MTEDRVQALVAGVLGRSPRLRRKAELLFDKARDLSARLAPIDRNAAEASGEIPHEPAAPDLDAILSAGLAQVHDLGERLRRVEDRRRALASGYTAEGLAALESFRARSGIADFDEAVEAFERANPPPEPVMRTSGGRAMLHGGGHADNPFAGFDDLMRGDDETFLLKSVPAALRFARGGP